MNVQTDWWDHFFAGVLVELLEDSGFAVETAQPWTREAHNVLFVATRR